MKKYLIIKLAAIGDVVMAMPMVREIRKREPDAYITWVCGQAVKELLASLPIDEIITVNERNLLRGNKLEKIQEVLLLCKKLSGRTYDIVAVGHADRRYQWLIKSVKAGCVRSFSHVIGGMCPIPGRHHTDEYVRLIYPDIEKNQVIEAIHLDFPLHSFFAKTLSSYSKNVILLPGGAKNLLADDFCRRWPIENYVELANLLIANGWQVILCGAKGDQWVTEHFKDLPIVNWIGKTTLCDMVAVFNHADVVVTHDSGPMHLAGAADCRLLALFGPTNPIEKVPRRRGIKYLWRGEHMSCCPCYDGKTYIGCQDNICLKSMTVQEVFDNLGIGAELQE